MASLIIHHRGRVVDSPGDNLLAEFSSVVDAVGKVIGEKRFLSRISRRTAVSAIIILLVVAGGLIGWNIYLHQSKRIEPASVEKMAFPLPGKPSIAVLPFVNMSGDPQQEYFVDGITKNIISALFKFKNLFIIASSSTFSYKGKPVKVQEVSEKLGVRCSDGGCVDLHGPAGASYCAAQKSDADESSPSVMVLACPGLRLLRSGTVQRCVSNIKAGQQTGLF